MNKITAAALCLIVTLIFSLNAQTYGLKLIGSAKLPNAINEDRVNIRGIDIQAIDNTGKFLTDSIGGDDKIYYGLVMTGQGKYSFYPAWQNLLVASTNFVQNINEGGIQKQITDEIVSRTIVETDKDTFQRAQQELTDRNLAQVYWLIKGPADDKEINGYLFEGAATKNKNTIQALEKTIPGISTFVTDYSFLVEDPVQNQELYTDTVIQTDPTTQLDNDRKANFDLKN